MNKVNSKNEKIKRRFFDWLKEADGCCDSTVLNVERAIQIYEEFTKYADFITYSPDKAKEFKKWLLKRTFRNKLISLTTYYSYTKTLHKFFLWLSWQAGYKRKITPDIVDYLKITYKEERIATQPAIRNIPSLEYVISLVRSIKINSEIDKRDRALISFTLLSGMRDKAIATLPLSCFDEEKLIIIQNPRQGVQTKFSKFIPTTIFKFNDDLVIYIIEWAKHLKSKGFGSKDPLFPRSRTEQTKSNLSFEPAIEVEPVFWRGAGRIREIFKNRAKDASLTYYPPHTFRHLAVDLALKYCKTGEEIKAVSQNFGHEHVATTLSSYGNYTPYRLSEIISQMAFSGKDKYQNDELMENIKKLILRERQC
jgi:integrase/recombinase XerD